MHVYVCMYKETHVDIHDIGHVGIHACEQTCGSPVLGPAAAVVLLHSHTQKHTCHVYMYMYVCMHTHTHGQAHDVGHAHVHVCMRTMHICIVQTFGSLILGPAASLGPAHTYEHICVHIHIYIYIYIYITYIYIYT